MPTWAGGRAVNALKALSIVACGLVASYIADVENAGAQADSDYTGSAACQDCHEDIFARWQHTRMANVLVDVDEHPEAILGDFSAPNPLVTFDADDITFTYGSRSKQRYFTRVGNDYFVLPAQWDVMNGTWRRYHPEAGTEWWTEYYPDDQMQRPTGDGCHSTNYDVATHEDMTNEDAARELRDWGSISPWRVGQ